MGIVVVTPPAAPLVSLDDAKRHLRVDFDDDDFYITDLVERARSWIDAPYGWLWRALVTQTLLLKLDRFAYQEVNIRLPFPNLIGVDSVKYIDTDGIEQTLDPSAWRIFGLGEIGSVAPAFNVSWPTIRPEPEAVRIQFRAGYGAATDVPPAIRHAVLLLIGHFYENREAEIVGPRAMAVELPTGVEALLTPFRVYA